MEEGESSNSNVISRLDSAEEGVLTHSNVISRLESPLSREKSKASQGRFLMQKKKMKCIYEETGHLSYTLFARALDINWGQDKRYWDWKCFKEFGEDGIEVAKLVKVYWFHVRGEINTDQLSPGIEYEAFFVVKLKHGASGWEQPVTLATSKHPANLPWDPNKLTECRNRQLSLLDQPRRKWIELSAGRFTVGASCWDIIFDLYEHDFMKKKRGLIVQGVIIRPCVVS